MLVADWIVDFGPGAGIKGGKITDIGTPAQFMKESNTLTAQYLRGDKVIVQPESRRPTGDKWVQICNARQNKSQSDQPQNTGGYPLLCDGCERLWKEFLNSRYSLQGTRPGPHEGQRLYRGPTIKSKGSSKRKMCEYPMSSTKLLTLTWHLSDGHRVPTLQPIQRFLTLFAHLYAGLPDAKLRGYKPGRFSFNVSGGRCEACNGNGAKKVDMGLLSDVWVECEMCNGKTLQQ